jgi:hypothetical protein
VKKSKDRQFVGYKLLQTLAGNNRNWNYFTASRRRFPQIPGDPHGGRLLSQLGKWFPADFGF